MAGPRKAAVGPHGQSLSLRLRPRYGGATPESNRRAHTVTTARRVSARPRTPQNPPQTQVSDGLQEVVDRARIRSFGDSSARCDDARRTPGTAESTGRSDSAGARHRLNGKRLRIP